MRGKLFYAVPFCGIRRIIPAHAGQTRRARRQCSCRPDHPRACGANYVKGRDVIVATGSSPRMRGKPSRSPVVLSCRRIIPAHAGQTSGSTWNQSALPDHPRACGANTIIVAIVGCGGGSSPRMRGKPYIRPKIVPNVRIIPAHAGQTHHLRQGQGPRSDHPRACGANSSRGSPVSLPDGSSPRMRGKPAQRVLRRQTARIIPAHAGQTSTKDSSSP